ncbi:MAG: enoyl-CoA hydratase/isomerase family protein [Calditrichaeota bacterium]|nr:MAG: enoyl-CoA hydratase/isomerase family protein [Calditrichota bacterium]MBL1208016.1 enoyl-CoA hydratase/isomerase family protein [Calditrichota bacterium]NOG47852.1 enoyl-CoA hydratase/isomerase family protein [Calditrichota bacterium]
MKNQISFVYEDQDFKSYLDGNIGIIKLKCNAYEIVRDYSESEYLFSILENVITNPEICALLLFNDPGCLNEEEYNQKKEKERSDNIDNSIVRSRQINVLNNFIKHIIELNKPVVFGLRGIISTPFFGASLAADFRFADENMCFLLSHLKHAKHPSGALPFFLPKYVGQGKATEILFTSQKINSSEALTLSLINEIFSEEDFETRCILETKKLSGITPSILRATKRLLIGYEKELNDYFENESKFILI